MRRVRIQGVTWSCPRCGRPFLTEQQMLVHYLACGKSRCGHKLIRYPVG